MKKKFSSMGRVAIALVLALSLSLVMGGPVSAETEGIIDIEKDWYKIGASVKVTVTDADLNVLATATDEESTTDPDGSETVFSITGKIVWPGPSASAKDMKRTAYAVTAANPVVPEVTLSAAPPDKRTLGFNDAADLGVIWGLDVQPYQATGLTATAGGTLTDDVFVITITGTDDVGPIDNVVTLNTGNSWSDSTALDTFESVSSIEVVHSGADEGDETLTITVLNKVYVTYSYHQADTVDVEMTSTIEVTPETLTLTETGVNTGIFEATITVAAGPAAADGNINVNDGDTITAKYVETEPAGIRSDTATVDSTLPVASNNTPADISFIGDITPMISVDITDLASGVDDTNITMTVAGNGKTPVVTAITNGFHVEYQIGGGEPLSEGSVAVIVNADDVAGNTLTEEWSFTVDLTPPTLASASATSRTTIDVTFTDNLDTELDPGTAEAADFLVDDASPSDVDVTDLVVTLTVAEMATNATPEVSITGNGVADRAGNFLTEGTVTATDDILPEVSVTVSLDPTTTYATSEVETTFTLTFSETMNTATQPVVTYGLTDPYDAYSVTGGWISGIVWEAEYDGIPQTDSDGLNTIKITTAADINGKAMADDTSNTFAIDTSVEATFLPEDGADVYTASPVVRISFGEVVTITAATFGGEDVLADLTTTDSMTYRLATEDLEEGGYTISVSAEDELGNTITDEEATFTVEVSQTISLYEGWNLISLPLIPDDPDITVVISATTLLSGNVSNVGIIRSYNPTTGDFPSYTPGTGGELIEMRDGYGYWVFMTVADTLTVSGAVMPGPLEVPPFYPVVVGWNLIGFKSVVPMIDYLVGPPPVGYLVNITGTYPVLWSYDAEAGAYSNVKDVSEGMEVGHGFWLWAEEAGTIVPPQ